MGLKVIITGTSGMVGEGILYECLQNEKIESVLVVGRKPCGIEHEKLKEILIRDFFNLFEIEDKIMEYDACFFCLGTTSVGKSKEDYFRITYELTLHFAKTLQKVNTQMTFCYVSGYGTDSTEKSKTNWARVKGKTENELMTLSFKQVFNYRPAFIKPIKGLKHTHKYYKYLNWFYPIGNALLPKLVTSLEELGLAMINSVLYGYDKQVIEVQDIKKLSEL